jgi:protein-tyrosine phosphatase
LVSTAGKIQAVPHVVFVCTGNAARSVMGGAVTGEVDPSMTVTTAGTHVVEGQPISWRTRDALTHVGLKADSHRSRQLRDVDVADADLIVGFEAIHVGYVRRNYPAAAGKTATLRYLVDHLPASGGDLAWRLAQLGLDAVVLERQEDVVDPAGGDVDDYVACAAEVDRLVRELVPRIQ